MKLIVRGAVYTIDNHLILIVYFIVDVTVGFVTTQFAIDEADVNVSVCVQLEAGIQTSLNIDIELINATAEGNSFFVNITTYHH